MVRDVKGGLHSRYVADDVCLHVHSTQSFKTTRVDLFIRSTLRAVDNTRLALIVRMLERGTERLPDIQRLNRFVDSLYGAIFAANIDQFGDRQVIHLALEFPDRRFIAAGEDLLRPGLDFLAEVLRSPIQHDGGFPQEILRQEKAAMAQYISSHLDDRMTLALRRCTEEMCAGEPYSLSSLGDPRDYCAIEAVELLQFHFEILSKLPIDIYVSGNVDHREIWEMVVELFSWDRCVDAARGDSRSVRLEIATHDKTKTFLERQASLQQGKLVIGFRTGVHLVDDAYPALLLLDLLFGGDANSRLYRTVREQSGLCYHVTTFLEPLCSLMFLEAGVDFADFDRFRTEVEEQILSVARSGPEGEELEKAKALAVHRLRAMADDREGLVRFWYHRRVAGAESRRAPLERAVESVTAEQVRDVAAGVSMDTIFFFHNGRDNGVGQRRPG